MILFISAPDQQAVLLVFYQSDRSPGTLTMGGGDHLPVATSGFGSFAGSLH
jgi:hypothetical protein